VNNLTFNKKRAREVLGRLYAAYQLRQGLFEVRHDDRGDAPQDKFIPEGVTRGSRLHAVFLFFATGTDRRQVSSNLYKSHMDFWERHPEMYQEQMLRMREQRVEKLIRSMPIGMKDDVVKNWRPCAQTLYGDLRGEPIALFAKGDIESVIEFKRSKDGDRLPGWGPKIISLYAIFLEKLGLVPVIYGAFPVDVHIQRICISTEIIAQTGILHREAVAEFIRPRLFDLCMEEWWDRSDLAHAMWFTGSELCNGCSSSRVVASLCTVIDLCGGGLNTRQYGKEGRWNFDQPRLPKGSPNLVLFPA
jgi:endonuclease III